MSTILVVDDAPMVRNIVNFTFKKYGVEVIEATDGFIAQKRLEQTPNIALIITAIDMPVMDGKNLIKAIKSNSAFKTIPIIAMKRDLTDSEKSDLQNLGAKAAIKKPLNRASLLETVEGIIGPFESDATPETSKGELDKYIRELKCVNDSTSIKIIHEMMADRGFRNMPITNSQDEPIGIISDRDILKHGVLKGDQLTVPDKQAKDIMVRKPTMVAPCDTLASVAQTMVSHRVDSVLIVENKKLKGIITVTDFLMLHLKN